MAKGNSGFLWWLCVAFIVLLLVVALSPAIWLGLVELDSALDERPLGTTALVAIATAIGALGTFAAASVAVVAIRDQRDEVKWTSSRDSLWRLSEAWEKLIPERGRLRVKVAWKRIDPNDADEDADAVLNFFDSAGFMANNHHIDDRMSWSWFYDDAKWATESLADYIADARKNNPALWAEIGPWLDRLKRVEQDERCKAQRNSA